MYLEEGKRALEYLSDPLSTARKVKGVLRSIREDISVYLFGSSLEGRYTAASDIDILAVVEGGLSEGERARIKALVYSAIDAPIELHVITRDELERWYSRFVGSALEV